MYVNEETAQLILDTIAWCNKDWMEALGWNKTDSDITDMSRGDFVRFCDARGIKGVEKVVKIYEDR